MIIRPVIYLPQVRTYDYIMEIILLSAPLYILWLLSKDYRYSEHSDSRVVSVWCAELTPCFTVAKFTSLGATSTLKVIARDGQLRWLPACSPESLFARWCRIGLQGLASGRRAHLIGLERLGIQVAFNSRRHDLAVGGAKSALSGGSASADIGADITSKSSPLTTFASSVH